MIPTRVTAVPRGPEKTGYLRVLREQWPVVAVAVIVCIASGLIGRQLVPSSYTARSDLLISPVDPSDDTFIGINVFRNLSSDPTANSLILARYLDTYATAVIVKRRLHLPDSPQALLTTVSVVPVSQTNIASVTATSSSPRTAQLLANAFAHAAIQRRTQEVQAEIQSVILRLQDQIRRSSANAASPQLATVQQRLSTLRSLVGLPDPTLAILNRAETPGAATKPSAKLVGVASALAGILLGFALALLAETFGGKIRREDDLLLRDRLPVLARIPKLRQSVVTEYLAGRANLPAAAWEPYRTLRANLLRAREVGETPVIVVTSAGAGDGKTLTALNLAVTLAARDMRVVLVDGDFRRPMIGSIFGVPSPREGFAATFVRGDVKAALVAAPRNPNLRLLLPTLRDLAQIDQLETDGVDRAFSALRKVADVVVVDSAPAGEVSDALLLASAADMTLLAVRVGFTRRDRFEALRDALTQYGIAASGLVVTVRSSPDYVVHGSTMPVAVELRQLGGLSAKRPTTVAPSRPARSTRSSNF
jgi:Mrp family chromosome partitioning ATPase/capsular polysaccharide biosynthesis protein